MNLMQTVQLDILEEFIHVLENKEITWFAGFGTLLGAARRGGFIPWDNDIDIIMPRPDYDKLRNMPKMFSEPYFLQTPQNDPPAAPRFMRLRRSDTAVIPEDYPTILTPGGHMGIYIDIIPMDTVPDIVVAKQMQGYGAHIHRRMHASAAWDECGYKIEVMPKKKEDFVKKGGGFPGFYPTFAEMYENVFTGFPEGSYYAMPALRGERGWRVYDKDWFAQVDYLNFESLRLPVPREWRAVLAVSYPNGTHEPDMRYNPYPQLIEEEKLIDTRRSYNEYTRKFTDMLKEIEGRDVYIFGAGDSLRIWLERYSQELNIVCAYDNSKEKHGSVAYGIQVRDPAELPNVISDNSRLIVASIYYKEIGKQLEDMGIDDYYVFIDGWKYCRQGGA